MQDHLAADTVVRIDRLDETLFDDVEAQLTNADRRALLALHGAVAASYGTFTYLEIGSFRGGSLQVVMRDPRCTCAISIDPRTDVTPDGARGSYTYVDNTTSRMRDLLAGLPGVQMAKLETFELSTEVMSAADLPHRPHWCFVDGEHTTEAVARDGAFCVDAIDGEGVVAFHDASMIAAGIERFLRQTWRGVSLAMALPGDVFAVEFGTRGVLRQSVVDRLLASRWHSIAWRLASRPTRSSAALAATWKWMPTADKWILDLKRGVGRGGRRRES